MIKKIVLQLKDKEIDLTLDEAKELQKVLSEMFDHKIVIKEHHHHETYPWRWTYPQVTYKLSSTELTCEPNSDVVYCAINKH